MKKSISHLKQKQEELSFLIDLIRKCLPQAEMIILYDSGRCKLARKGKLKFNEIKK